MKHECIANEIYWAMEHGEFAKVDQLIENLVRVGISYYAWWKDGEQFVGSCGTTLKEALTTEKLPVII